MCPSLRGTRSPRAAVRSAADNAFVASKNRVRAGPGVGVVLVVELTLRAGLQLEPEGDRSAVAPAARSLGR